MRVGGVCGAIFKAAGALKLQEACNKLSPINTGEAVITDGFNCPAKYIIHTAGPVYRDGNPEQARQLYNCYYNSMKLADSKGLSSIAFPLISSGIYGYPPHEALDVAQKAIHDYLAETENDIDVHLIVFNNDAFKASLDMFDDVESYIDENLIVDDRKERRHNENFSISNLFNISVGNSIAAGAVASEPKAFESKSLDEFIGSMDAKFSDLLFKYIREKGMTNAEVYKNANVDRKLFSKIISTPDYTPSKQTIFALAVSLRLNIDEATSLLESAGYAFSHSSRADLIVEYYIRHPKKVYNIDDLNFLLFKYGQVQLGQKVK